LQTGEASLLIFQHQRVERAPLIMLARFRLNITPDGEGILEFGISDTGGGICACYAQDGILNRDGEVWVRYRYYVGG